MHSSSHSQIYSILEALSVFITLFNTTQYILYTCIGIFTHLQPAQYIIYCYLCNNAVWVFAVCQTQRVQQTRWRIQWGQGSKVRSESLSISLLWLAKSLRISTDLPGPPLLESVIHWIPKFRMLFRLDLIMEANNGSSLIRLGFFYLQYRQPRNTADERAGDKSSYWQESVFLTTFYLHDRIIARTILGTDQRRRQ